LTEVASAYWRLAPVLNELRAQGLAVEVRHELFNLELPHGASEGLSVSINGDVFDAILFEVEDQAVDELLWSSHAMVAGRLMLSSTPQLYSESTNTNLLKKNEISWSALCEDEIFESKLAKAVESLPSAGSNQTESINLSRAIERLRAGGVEIVVHRACFRDTQPVGAFSGAYVEIARDPFYLYRFASKHAAQVGSPDPLHSVQLDNFVFRSDPRDVYVDLARVTKRRDDEDVSWSALIESGELKRAWSKVK